MLVRPLTISVLPTPLSLGSFLSNHRLLTSLDSCRDSVELGPIIGFPLSINYGPCKPQHVIQPKEVFMHSVMSIYILDDLGYVLKVRVVRPNRP